jgi:myo-inositol-1(or 4)-monophosphatase
LLKDGIEQLGIVYNPFNGELFSAIKGEGAFLNNKKIQVSNEENIKKNICLFGIPYDRTKLKDIFNYVYNVSALFADCKRIGPSSLDICSVACGRATAYIELDLKKWDILAGKLILEEAGGLLVSINGNIIDITNDSFSIIACSEYIQHKIFKML